MPVPIVDRREAGRRAGRDLRRRGALDQAALRDHARRLHRLLPQRRRAVRRAGADGALPRRGPPRVSPRSLFVPGSRPFDLFDPDRKGRIKLYVKRVFITDDAEILPRYLRFVRGLVDSADLPLNVSREMIQESPILAAIKKGVTGRVLGDLEKLAESDAEAYAKIWENFGAVLKEGLYEDFERRDTLLALARFKTTASGERAAQPQGLCRRAEGEPDRDLLSRRQRSRAGWKPRRISKASARAASRCCCSTDPVDSFWVTSAPSFDGKPFKSVTQGAADLALIPLPDAKEKPADGDDDAVSDLHRFRQADARRRGLGRARVRPADRQRGLPGGVRLRPRPAVREAPRRRRPAQGGGQADPRDQSAHELRRGAGQARRRATARSRRTPRICCSTRRACSTASSRPTRAASPTASPASSAAVCRPAGRRDQVRWVCRDDAR